MSLDPMPSPARLRALAAERGAKVAGGSVAPRSPRQAPSVRPWAPYRSKWEKEYAGYLRALEQTGLISGWEYEPERLEIGVKAFYTPDFMIRMGKQIEWREVKGYKREAAMVRIRAAAKQYPHWRFVLVTKKRGAWVHTPITPEAP